MAPSRRSREQVNLRRREFFVIPSIAVSGWAIGESQFKAPAASSMKSRVELDHVIIGVEAFDTAEKTAKAFGKLDPNKYEVLPVLMVIQNNRKTALRVSPLDVQYIVPGMGKVDALRLDEVTSAGGGPNRPNLGPKPLPLPTRVKKNPLAGRDIEERAFVAKMIAPGESASGFFYFNLRHRTTAKIYVNGLADAATKNEIFYFEIPFAD